MGISRNIKERSLVSAKVFVESFPAPHWASSRMSGSGRWGWSCDAPCRHHCALLFCWSEQSQTQVHACVTTSVSPAWLSLLVPGEVLSVPPEPSGRLCDAVTSIHHSGLSLFKTVLPLAFVSLQGLGELLVSLWGLNPTAWLCSSSTALCDLSHHTAFVL